MKNDTEHLLKGVAAGLVGGLVATFVMTRYQSLMQPLLERHERPGRQRHPEERSRERGDAGDRRTSDVEASSATLTAAQRVSRKVTGEELDPSSRKTASLGVHYAVGVTAGGIYGALAEREVDPGRWLDAPLKGAGHGTAVWLLADELATPALGLSEPPWELSASSHAHGLAAHLVYGVSLGLAARGTRVLLDQVFPPRRSWLGRMQERLGLDDVGRRVSHSRAGQGVEWAGERLTEGRLGRGVEWLGQGVGRMGEGLGRMGRGLGRMGQRTRERLVG